MSLNALHWTLCIALTLGLLATGHPWAALVIVVMTAWSRVGRGSNEP